MAAKTPEIAEPLECETISCPVDTCLVPADLVLVSSDGIRVGAHSHCLELYSGGFISVLPTISATEALEETAEVLEILMYYMHNGRQPSSRNIPFHILQALAAAAEKYLVYSAMEVLNLQMERYIPSHPLQVLIYAVKYDYPDLSDKAGPLSIGVPFETVLNETENRPDILLLWTRYREYYLEIVHTIYASEPAPVLHPGGIADCGKWSEFHYTMLNKVAGSAEGVSKFSHNLKQLGFMLAGCFHCVQRSENWKHAITKRVEKIPAFSSMA
ncbi:hypothetical protein BDQ12DRAFT_727172 [Crucibulum laeve]|uniref:BTB domain-containing protein n=1 Tax=Crucibulum laeve TaxID=68775 RepID=A0A5C3LZC2_9AGAR|nr:hypothetical protein BDQ12DRAFT_727172 [Crucibulum laeve]